MIDGSPMGLQGLLEGHDIRAKEAKSDMKKRFPSLGTV